jgi:4a-hydroxytetrahydrobiopterin dehydratase
MLHRDRLSDIAIQRELGRLPGWARRGETLVKSYAFPSYLAGIDFVNRVAHAAEAANHHPDLDVRYAKVVCTLSTHSAAGSRRRISTWRRPSSGWRRRSTAGRPGAAGRGGGPVASGPRPLRAGRCLRRVGGGEAAGIGPQLDVAHHPRTGGRVGAQPGRRKRARTAPVGTGIHAEAKRAASARFASCGRSSSHFSNRPSASAKLTSVAPIQAARRKASFGAADPKVTSPSGVSRST